LIHFNYQFIKVFLTNTDCFICDRYINWKNRLLYSFMIQFNDNCRPKYIREVSKSMTDGLLLFPNSRVINRLKNDVGLGIRSLLYIGSMSVYMAVSLRWLQSLIFAAIAMYIVYPNPCHLTRRDHNIIRLNKTYYVILYYGISSYIVYTLLSLAHSMILCRRRDGFGSFLCP